MSVEKKVYYRWKCQDCGLTYEKTSPDEPRRGCPCCKRKGVKSYRGKRIVYIQNKKVISEILVRDDENN